MKKETPERTLADAIALCEKASERCIKVRSAHMKAEQPTTATKKEK